ncbi:hypothetical protein Zmor_020353 [Zophobas morio]|uniref:Uncharacterized protein n=1 Tax=Zophobas morio TaxID=2755281 RepID=A0AA38I3F7_9CUCU|nr:hypothetical protein Zmor_020353 [Zophobas morio]
MATTPTLHILAIHRWPDPTKRRRCMAEPSKQWTIGVYHDCRCICQLNTMICTATVQALTPLPQADRDHGGGCGGEPQGSGAGNSAKYESGWIWRAVEKVRLGLRAGRGSEAEGWISFNLAEERWRVCWKEW